jgi:hypothetical protein
MERWLDKNVYTASYDMILLIFTARIGATVVIEKEKA